MVSKLLPGHSGFVPGERTEYGHTYGHTHRHILPQTPAPWCDRTPKQPRLISVTDTGNQLPGYGGFAPHSPRAKGLFTSEVAVVNAGAQWVPMTVYNRSLRENQEYATRLSQSSIKLGAGEVQIMTPKGHNK